LGFFRLQAAECHTWPIMSCEDAVLSLPKDAPSVLT